MPRSTALTTTALATLLGAITMLSAISAHGADLPTTCAQEADAVIDEGLTLLHNMMYIQAEAAFNRAADADPHCAMAQWGIAMANFHPLWPGGQTEDETARGTVAAERLAELTPGNDLEQALADAASAFYAPDHDGYPACVAAWSEAQNAAHDRNPDNIDAAALAALARLATAPRGPEGIEVNAAVGDLLDSLHRQAPDHPGVIHYAIHAYDNPALKDRGLPYAEIYDKAAPDAAHALHVPADILTRTGDWERSIDLNRRSAKAALDQSGDVVQTHYVHAIEYMVYGHLQLGQPDEAARLVDQMLGMDNHQVSFGGAYALAAAPVRLLLEKEKWAEAAALAPEMLRRWADFMARALRPCTVWADLATTPSAPFLPEEVHGQKVLILMQAWAGDPDEGETVLAPLKDDPTAVGGFVARRPYVEAQSFLDQTYAKGARNYWGATNYDAISDALIEDLVNLAEALPTAESDILLIAQGGAIDDVPTMATAYPDRGVPFMSSHAARWRDPADDAAVVVWTKDSARRLARHGRAGAYVNFLSEREGGIDEAYAKHLARLAEIKARYDPRNLFRVNQNILPAAPAPD